MLNKSFIKFANRIQYLLVLFALDMVVSAGVETGKARNGFIWI